MSDPRYVIAARSAAVAESWLREIDLPDAEHVHVTRHPDGTITATPMEYHGHKHRPSQTTWIYGPERPPTADEIVLWLDIEDGPEGAPA